MRSPVALKSLSVILFVFALGHTLGTSSPQVRRGPAEAALFRAMQSYRFPIMGFTRSYWDFYRGFALTISVQLALMAVIAWQVGSLAQRDPRLALSLGVTLLLGCIGVGVISWFFFFGGPIVFSAVTVLLAGAAVVLLRRGRAHRRLAEAHPQSPAPAGVSQ